MSWRLTAGATRSAALTCAEIEPNGTVGVVALGASTEGVKIPPGLWAG